MSDKADDLPVLTEVVAAPRRKPTPGERVLNDADLARLRERLTVGSFELMERLINESLQDLEVQLYEGLTARLRDELPALVERVLDQQLRTARRQQNKPGSGHGDS